MSSILLFAALLITSCSTSSDGDEEVNEPVIQSVTLELSELSNSSGNSKIYYVADVGIAWSAEIISGEDFVSFSSFGSVSSKSGVVASSQSNVLYFYYDTNEYIDDRTAVISFKFDDSQAVELTINQLSAASSDNPYKSDDSPRWNEIPAKVDDDNYIYVSHSVTLNGAEVRNFSICFDVENLASAWVAYPYHTCYDGDVDRTDDWGFDPKIPEAYQANVGSKSYTSSSHDRGHQLASADRLATVEMNSQTFYFSNMTPQYSSLNQGKWASLETAVRNQVCSDTLFVVTGADFTTTVGSTTDNDGKVCPLPGGYYKVLLRTRTGRTGKAVSECTADELQAIGFWFDHTSYSAIPDPVSVKEIEEKTGFTFFPNVPSDVKATFKSSDWSF